MADTAIAITAGTGTNVDTRTEGTNGNHRQVVVVGDPATNAGVAPVDGTAGLKVDLGSDNDVTVTGTVDLGATDNAVLDAIAASVAAIDTDTTAIIADTTNIETAVQLIDDVIYVDDADWSDGSSKHALVGGLYQSTPQTVTDGDVAPFNITANGALHVSDAGGSLTVDGTVTANLSATDNQVLDDIKVDTEAIETAVEAIQAAQLPDGHNVTVDNASIAVTNAGLTELAAAVNASSQMDVNIAASDISFGGTSAADDADFTATTTPGTPAMGVYESTPTSVTDGDLGVVGITTGRRLKTSATVDAALPAGTNNIGDVDILTIAAGDNNIGNVDIVTLPGDVEADIDQIRDQIDLITPDIEEIRADADSIRVATELIDDAIYADDADWTDNTSKHMLVGGIYQSSPHTVTDGDVAPVSLDANGNVKVNIVAGSSAGTQYTEGDEDASITGTAMMMEVAADIVEPVQGTVADGLLVNLGSNNDVTVAGVATAANQSTIIGHVDGIETLLGTIDADTSNISTKIDTVAGDTTSIQTAVELIDDTVQVLGTDTYSEATSKGITLGAVRRDADTTLVNTTNEFTPLQVDANGRLKVEAFSGEALPVTLTSTTVTGTVAVTQSGTWDEVGINDSGNSITVDNGGTFATQVDGAALTALQLIDNSIYVDDADWTADTSSHTLVGAVTQVATTANTDGDTTPLTTNGMRELRTAVPESDLATAGTAHVKKYYTNAGAVTDGIIWSPAAGKRWYVTDIFINVSAAATVTLEDDLSGGDSPVWKAELAANSGWSHSFNTPLYSGEDAADLIITTTAGNVYVTVTGYEV